MTIDDQIASLEREGWRLVQRGRVHTWPGAPGLTFCDRVDGCTPALIKSGDKLIDDEHEWAHLQR